MSLALPQVVSWFKKKIILALYCPIPQEASCQCSCHLYLYLSYIQIFIQVTAQEIQSKLLLTIQAKAAVDGMTRSM